MKLPHPYKKMNQYHVNRRGRVIKLNNDGSTTVLGKKGTLVGNLVVGAIAFGLVEYGRRLERVINS